MTDRLAAYSDERLQAVELDYQAPGPYRQAQQLLRLDTPERRARASAEGHTLVNLIGGQPSSTLGMAVSNLLDAIARGEEDKELYGERVARQEREKDEAYRAAVRGY